MCKAPFRKRHSNAAAYFGDESPLYATLISTYWYDVKESDSCCESECWVQPTFCSSSNYPLEVSWGSEEGLDGQIVLARTGCLAVWGGDINWLSGEPLRQLRPTPEACWDVCSLKPQTRSKTGGKGSSGNLPSLSQQSQIQAPAQMGEGR
jgi:hypothetical protein